MSIWCFLPVPSMGGGGEGYFFFIPLNFILSVLPPV